MRQVEPVERHVEDHNWFRSSRARLAGVFIIRSLGIVALFGFEITFAKALGVAGYGAFSFALAIAIIVSRLASLGWLNAITRLVSAFRSTAQFALLKGSVVAAHVATGLGLVAAALVLGLIAQNTDILTLRDAYLAVLPLAAALAVLELHRYALRGLDAGDLGELLPFLLLPVIAAGVVWALSVGDADTAILVYTAVVVVLVLVSTVSILFRLPPQVRACKAEYRIREWSLAAFAMLVGSASDEISARMAVLVLGGLGNETDAGLYQAAMRLSMMTVFFLRVLTPVAASRISVLYHAGKLEELRAMYLRLSALSFAGALPFVLLFWIFPEFVLGWFGPGFHDAAPILRVLSLGYLASASAGPCATALMMIGRERIYGMIALTTVILNAGLCYVLAVNFGGIGAAIAVASVAVLNNGLYVAVFYRVTSPRRQQPTAPRAPSGE